MKVAFATTDGNTVNEHFGRAGLFAVYEITASAHRFIELRKFSEGLDQAIVSTREQGQAHEDAVENKVARLADCKLVFLTEIGGPSAARLVKRGIMPMKVKEAIPIEIALNQLQETVKQSPPPWLRKALNKE